MLIHLESARTRLLTGMDKGMRSDEMSERTCSIVLEDDIRPATSTLSPSSQPDTPRDFTHGPIHAGDAMCELRGVSITNAAHASPLVVPLGGGPLDAGFRADEVGSTCGG